MKIIVIEQETGKELLKGAISTAYFSQLQRIVKESNFSAEHYILIVKRVCSYYKVSIDDFNNGIETRKKIYVNMRALLIQYLVKECHLSLQHTAKLLGDFSHCTMISSNHKFEKAHKNYNPQLQEDYNAIFSNYKIKK